LNTAKNGCPKVVLTAKEAPSEQELAREYDGKVEELLKRISNF